MLGVMGWQLELVLGKLKFLLLYFAAGLCGNLLSAFAEIRTGEYAVSAGASGAIFGSSGRFCTLRFAITGGSAQSPGRGSCS